MPTRRKRLTATSAGTLIGAALLAAASLTWPQLAAASPESERWQQQALAITIVRNEWGIAHIRAPPMPKQCSV
jgi:hypothetical protein